VILALGIINLGKIESVTIENNFLELNGLCGQL